MIDWDYKLITTISGADSKWHQTEKKYLVSGSCVEGKKRPGWCHRSKVRGVRTHRLLRDHRKATTTQKATGCKQDQQSSISDNTPVIPSIEAARVSTLLWIWYLQGVPNKVARVWMHCSFRTLFQECTYFSLNNTILSSFTHSVNIILLFLFLQHTQQCQNVCR